MFLWLRQIFTKAGIDNHLGPGECGHSETLCKTHSNNSCLRMLRVYLSQYRPLFEVCGQ